MDPQAEAREDAALDEEITEAEQARKPDQNSGKGASGGSAGDINRREPAFAQ
jgi:hypothetical protein